MQLVCGGGGFVRRAFRLMWSRSLFRYYYAWSLFYSHSDNYNVRARGEGAQVGVSESVILFNLLFTCQYMVATRRFLTRVSHSTNF
jgi:hypothetical protein